MAATIVVTCPECKKQVRAPEDIQGKRIRCKGCSHVFTVPGAAAPAPKKPAEEPEHYGVIQEDESIPRCPHCAHQLEHAEAIICLHCGYNMHTRQRVATKKVIETTQQDQLAWLMPGIAALVVILALIGFDLFACLALPALVKDGDYEFIGAKGARVWIVIASLFGMFFAGKFAYQRLILQPKPPEREKDV